MTRRPPSAVLLLAPLSALLTAALACTEPAPPVARGMYLPITEPQSVDATMRGFAVGGAPLPVFLNRNGGTYTGGQDNSSTNRSSVVQSGSRTVRGYTGTEAQWQEIVACVQDEFARFNLTVTDVEPSGGVEYVEAVIGDVPGSVNLPSGVGGVAPIDTFTCNIIPRAIVYTFAEVVGNDPQVVCEITAQEVAHAFSLDHEYLASDPMTYLNYAGHKTFQDQSASCGEYQPRACSCGGATQNSVQVMLEKLGPVDGTPVEPIVDPVPPGVAVVSPADGDDLPANATIEVVAEITDDVNVATAELLWSYNNSVFACPGTYNGGAATCTRSGSTFTWNIRVGTGTRTFQVRARDAGGNVVTSAPRTISLDGAPIDDADDVLPEVAIVSPADGAQLAGNGAVTVVATASDDQGLGQVELVWTYANAAFGCPLSQTNISCTVDGDMYTWTLNVATGTRAFQVRAIDVAGNMTVTAEHEISLSNGPPEEPVDPVDPVTPGDDAYEDNDVIGDAATIACGEARDLAALAGDADWFTVPVAVGVKVFATITSTAPAPIALSLHGAAAGAPLVATDDAVAHGLLEATADDAAVAVQIAIPPGSDPADYRLAVQCDDGTGPAPIDPTTPAGDDASEPNDAADEAAELFCRQSAQLHAADEDWFTIDVRAGDALEAHFEADADVKVELLAADGAAIPGATLTSTAGVVRAAGLAAGSVLLRVAPATVAAGYDLRIACADGPDLPMQTATCAGAGVPRTSLVPTAALLALGVILAGRRRRRG